MKLICVFVFAYAKSPFSHDAALMIWGQLFEINDIVSEQLILIMSITIEMIFFVGKKFEKLLQSLVWQCCFEQSAPV